MNTWQLLPLVPIRHPADGNGAGKATESRWTTLTGEVRQDGCSKQKERWRKLSKVPLSSAAVGQEGVASHSLLPSVGVQGRRKRRGSRCSWRGEIVTSTLSAPQNPGWHFSLPSSRIPPYQLHVTADLQSGPISVNVRRWSPATAASPPCAYAASLLAGHSSGRDSTATRLPQSRPHRWAPALSLVTEHRKKKFHRSLSRDLSKTLPYQIDRGRFFSPSLIWEALTFKVQPSSQRNRVPEEERDSNTWNT